MSCSEDVTLKDELIGSWQLKSITTTCILETSEVTNDKVDANEMGCATLLFTDTTETTILTIEQTLCSLLIIEEDDTALLISGDKIERDTIQLSVHLNIEDNSIELCDIDANCINYQYSDFMISTELPLAVMSSSQCTRLLAYSK